MIKASLINNRISKWFLISSFCSVSSSLLADTKSINCLLSGEGSTDSSHYGRSDISVRIEQTFKFNEKTITQFQQRFLSKHNFQEGFFQRDGQKYGWLELNSSVEKDRIKFSMNAKPGKKKSETVNVEVLSYIFEVTINRASGRAVSESSSRWTLENRGKVESINQNYYVSGDCSISGKNKF